jgi:hypothetical protein
MSDIPRGLLSGLEDPNFMARLKERDRLLDHLTERVGCSRRTAGFFLREFEEAAPGDLGAPN